MLDVKALINKLLEAVPTSSETTDSSGVATVTYKKYGRVVMCTVGTVSSRSVAGWTSVSLGTIPTGYRPAINIGFLPITRQSVSTFIPVYFGAQPDGTIRYVNQSGTSYTTGTIMSTTYTWLTA